MQKIFILRPLLLQKLKRLSPLLIVVLALGLRTLMLNSYSTDHKITQHLEQEVVAIKDSLLCSLKSDRIVSLVKEIQIDTVQQPLAQTLKQ